MLLRPILLPTHTFLLLFFPIQSLPCAPSCGQPMFPHKESILSPAMSSRRKAWITVQTVQGERVFSEDFFGVVADFPANIIFAFSFRPQVLRAEFITLLHSRHDYSQHQGKALLDLVCAFTLQVPTLSPLPPLRPLLMCLIYILEWMASIGTSRSTLHISWPSSGTLGFICRVNSRRLLARWLLIGFGQ